MTQRNFYSMIESQSRPGKQERRARQKGRERQPHDDNCQSDPGDGRAHVLLAVSAGDSGGSRESMKVAAAMPAIAATNRPSRNGIWCASSATTAATTPPTMAGRALSTGPTNATSA